MRNTTKILFSGALISMLAFATVAQAEEDTSVTDESVVQPVSPVPGQPDATQSPTQPEAQGAPDAEQEQPKNYDVNEFFSDAQRYTVGDVVPDKYRSKPYEIVEWQKRHLPAPEIGSHWTYMGGNYVLITDGEGKIMQIKSGEIFFR
ncbi:RcnB family protein [Mixta intestinalis]|jgi:Ni/Co efflux regulator RcnB|uniref:Nickel/cobalt homeostasis protein RcnB n=1 Tax=Mixta intestinalis TaxID=1615494 RepID=A0A6P1Q476_9GAMM|nr:RcnB family protein [Mixta intestinalis]QHM73870.1 Nickel/cobalt homeostasis protein RcnB [Mixta intestinalis]